MPGNGEVLGWRGGRREKRENGTKVMEEGSEGAAEKQAKIEKKRVEKGKPE